MTSFKDLKFEKLFPGEEEYSQCKLFFLNGYGVSVITGEIGCEGWELAVLKGEEINWTICYNTSITKDVCKHLSPEDVTDLIQQVEALS